MRQIVYKLLFILITIPFKVHAQHEISGRIVQQDRNTPLEFANIVLNTPDSVFVTGTTSGRNGKFRLSGVSSGDYALSVSFMGYATEKVAVKNVVGSVDLGDIALREEAASLGEVAVTASSTVNKVDKLVVFITEQQKALSGDGINLLASLQLPRLNVNPLMNSIALAGDGKIRLCVNGVRVDENDVKALKPDEIARIEYFDNTGVRYGDADVVINYILKRATTGGIVGINLMNAVTSLFGNELVSVKLNHRKSEFGFVYTGRFRELDKVKGDKTSRFRFAEKEEMVRYDNGIPGEFKENAHHFALNYNYLDEKRYFNASVRQAISDNNKMSYTEQYTSIAPSRSVLTRQGGNTLQYLPSVDLYYLRSFGNKQTLILNAVGTYIDTDVDQVYEETKGDSLITGIISNVNGKKYSLIGEGIYEKIYGNNNRFTAGLKHTQAIADNRYTGTVNSLARMDQSESYAYLEYSGRHAEFSYMAGAGVSRWWTKQEGEKPVSGYVFRPKATLQYNFRPELFIRLKGEIYNTTPTLANLSAVDQYIDTLRVTRGNPGLKSNMNYQLGLTLSWEGKRWGLYYDASYRYTPDAIMEDIFREGDLFITTYNNQKNWQKLNNEVTLKIKPAGNMLTLSLTGGINNYRSNGNSYSHTHTNYYYRASATFMYKKFMAYFNANSAYDNLWGETVNGGETMHQLALAYNLGKCQLGAGVLSPFSGNYKRKTENRNRFSPYESYGYIDNLARMIMVTFSWNFDFGRKAKSGSKRLNNLDSETGIIMIN